MTLKHLELCAGDRHLWVPGHCPQHHGLLYGLGRTAPDVQARTRKIKDHIAIAKLNGYQSLHTTLVVSFGVNIEFQMRTEEMHLIAEV